MKYVTTVGESRITIDINREGEVTVNGQSHELDFKTIGSPGAYSILLDNKSYEALIEEGDGEYRVLIDGVLYTAHVVDERAQRLASAAGAFAPSSGEVTVKSPMPGLIVAVPVKEGDHVKKGQVILILESMKMENELKAPRDAVVSSVKVSPPQAVEQNQVLLTLS